IWRAGGDRDAGARERVRHGWRAAAHNRLKWSDDAFRIGDRDLQRLRSRVPAVELNHANGLGRNLDGQCSLRALRYAHLYVDVVIALIAGRTAHDTPGSGFFV